ncbi:hypothetical protein C8Q70DRAFT_377441 [Cubamyces menziesii]|uniref:Uncharacterized protein n=1 Tax=Trametes cubensis TaxID=1111947 RepID=A0AAD7U2C9_9APHY|nr:hypothetical protein C8Q70DRAFT_377441 [Cubamyces menziesii]KAJ8496619.1 hypothetical protein ONZ51_g1004 [Trametes cubensis]
MLGQKIIESYADFENDNASYLLPEPSTGLTIRRIKSAGLRIVTESETLSSENAFRDNTNTLRPPATDHRLSYLSVRTPDTSHTFGVPNPSMLSVGPSQQDGSASSTPSSASGAEALAARRLSRYSRAESALHSAVELSSAEVSPQELQIRALEQATALLSEQARDAQSCAERLRACLADKELKPEELKALQRERWLEEHRSRARHDQSLHTRELATKLASPIREDVEPLFASPADMTRHEANLARFLQHSPTRVAFPTTRSPSISPAVAYRRETISQVRPMRLRPSAMELALRSPVRTHSRSKSLDGARHSRSGSDMTDATFVSQGSSGQTAVAQTSVPDSKATTSPPIPPLPTRKGDGVVTIEHSTKLRTRDELLAEVGDVALPEYAVDLLEDLSSSNLDITLRQIVPADAQEDELPTQSTSVAPSESPSILTFARADTGLFTPPRSPFSDRLRTQSDASSTPSLPGSTTPIQSSPNARRRSGLIPKSPFRQSLHVPKFSSLRLSSPSLVPVDEAERPRSSMSARAPLPTLDSSSSVNVNAPRAREQRGSAESADSRRRFSVVSFRRLEQEGAAGDGILARFRRRFSALGQ